MNMKSSIKLSICICVILSILDLVSAKKKKDKFIYASCNAEPNPEISSSNVRGSVRFRQKANGGQVTYRVDMTGFDNTDKGKVHGMHVHTFGTITNGCGGAAGHFNPFDKPHGGPKDTERHVGDLGNIREKQDGSVNKMGKDSVISLKGKTSILGRAIVFHALKDDLGRGGDDGSIATGNAGARLACCVIVASDGSDF